VRLLSVSCGAVSSRAFRSRTEASLVLPQPERSQLRASRRVIRMENASNHQTFRDLNEHRRVFDVDDLTGWRLGDVQGESKDVNIGLANVYEARRNKRVHKPVELELANPVRIHLAGFVADHDDLESVVLLELRD